MLKNKKLPLWAILNKSFDYCWANWRLILVFTVVFYLLGAGAIWSWRKWLFLPIIVGLYAVWGMFFRVYFKRKPYWNWKALFNSLVPSTKIVLLTVLIATGLILLPMVPLFINISPEFDLAYAKFLQGDIEQSKMLLLVANVVFLLISPWVAYRPFLAWISALIGRSGSLRQAWVKTKGNYFEFLFISIWTDCILSFVHWLSVEMGGNDYITMIFAAVLVSYFNVVSALSFEFFFLNKDDIE